jgi:nucleoid DNA-binding protein
MIGLWDLISLVRAVVREMGILGIFQFHHKPHPKTSLNPSQTSFINIEKNRVRRQVKSLVRNQVGSLMRSRVKSLTPSLSQDQTVSIVSFVERMVTSESFAIRERERREWLRSGRTRTGTTLLMVRLSLVCHCLRERDLCVRIRHGDMRNPVAAVVV